MAGFIDRIWIWTDRLKSRYFTLYLGCRLDLITLFTLQSRSTYDLSCDFPWSNCDVFSSFYAPDTLIRTQLRSLWDIYTLVIWPSRFIADLDKTITRFGEWSVQMRDVRADQKCIRKRLLWDAKPITKHMLMYELLDPYDQISVKC